MQRILFGVLLLMLAGCATAKEMYYNVDETINEYNRLVRWQQWSAILERYVETGGREAYIEAIPEIRKAQIVDYRVIVKSGNKEDKEQKVQVEFDYYLPPALKLLTVEDRQTWRYTEDGWRLSSSPPTFTSTPGDGTGNSRSNGAQVPPTDVKR